MFKDKVLPFTMMLYLIQRSSTAVRIDSFQYKQGQYSLTPDGIVTEDYFIIGSGRTVLVSGWMS